MPQIARLETFHNEFVCFVRVTSEDGAFGWGQTSTYNADITAQVFLRQIVPWALGANCEDIGPSEAYQGRFSTSMSADVTNPRCICRMR